MSYQTLVDQAVHTPCTLVEIDLDWCGNTFGVSPCTATGEPCYNTYPTCKDKANFARTTKTYSYSSADAPHPGLNARPYVSKVSYQPTEIKDSLTVKAKTTIDLLDEPDGDVGIDPYLSSRASVPQTSYWRKLIARNPNYTGRRVRIYDGAIGPNGLEKELRWQGKISAISIGRGTVRIEVADLLMSLKDIKVPPKLKIKLNADIDATQTDIVLDVSEGLTPSGYVVIDDEIIAYSGLDTAQNKLTGCTRGAFGTTAAAHSSGDTVKPAIYWPPTNPFDILKGMLLNDPDPTVSYPDPPGAGLDPTDVDTATFDAVRDYPGGEIDFSTLVTEEEDLATLFWEIVNLLDCRVWYSEGQTITIARNMPNSPGRSYTDWSDETTVLDRSAKVDLNPGSRLSRVVLRYDKEPLAKADEETSYRKIDVSAWPDAERPESYGEPAEDVLLCRWLRSDYLQEEILEGFVRGLTARRLVRRVDALPIIDVEVYIKDGAVRTGANVRFSTDELLLPDGSPLDKALFQIIKRHPKGHKLGYRLLKMPSRRIAFFAPAGHPDYASATDSERQYGFFTDADGKMSDGSDGYYFW